MTRNTDQNGKSKRTSAVVVGVDGSAGAKAALRWALAEARLRNLPVRAVHAWTFGYIGGSVEGYPYWGGSLGSYTSLGIELNDLHRAAEDLLERAIADVETETEGVEIDRQVIQGPAAEALVQAASDVTFRAWIGFCLCSALPRGGPGTRLIVRKLHSQRRRRSRSPVAARTARAAAC